MVFLLSSIALLILACIVILANEIYSQESDTFVQILCGVLIIILSVVLFLLYKVYVVFSALVSTIT